MRLLSPDDFIAASHPVPLDDEEVQLWFFADVARSETRACLTGLLSAYLPGAPGALTITAGEFGKPRLVRRDGLEFNLSHSRDAMLVAISRRQPLGVDIERARRSRPALELARRFFAADEAEALARVAPARRQAAFLMLWSCKEAVVKALGRGLGFGLANLAFELDAAGAPVRLNVIDASAGPTSQWQIVRVRPQSQYTGALAWCGPSRRVRAFTASGR